MPSFLLQVLLVWIWNVCESWPLRNSRTHTGISTRRGSVVNDSEIVTALRREVILPFDTEKYDFKGEVRKILQFFLEIEDLPALNELHHKKEATEFRLNQSKGRALNRVNRIQSKWNLHRARLPEYAAIYKDFDELYNVFIQEVIAPDMSEQEKIIYQRAPTLRICIPSEFISCKIHHDREYNHQPSELNFWMPLTDAFANNSLWVESEPFKNDFHCLDMCYGQYFRFYGNQCRHFTKPNDTGKTRVSLDYRVVSNKCGGHNPSFRQGINRGPKAQNKDTFDIPHFYQTGATIHKK